MSEESAAWELTLWPYRSLLRKDFVLFIGSTALIISLPLIALLGTPVLWGILPFFVIMMVGLWIAIGTSYKRGEVLERLTTQPDQVALVRHNPDGSQQKWRANTYWTRVEIHKTGGPVNNYLTLHGGDRVVEIGGFLDESERLQLFEDLQSVLTGHAPRMG